jgi:hypothetical protein
MELGLHFVPKEEIHKRHSPTPDEIHQIASVALGIESIIRVMSEYTCDTRKDNDMLDNCSFVFDILKLLVAPVTQYLTEYAGELAVEPPVIIEEVLDFDESDRGAI